MKYIVLIVVIVAFIGCEVDPFGPNSRDVKGVVFNNLNEPVFEAQIKAEALEEDMRNSNVYSDTDDIGQFSLNDLSLGSYKLSVSKDGYRNNLEHINIEQDDSPLEINITLIGNPEIRAFSLKPLILKSKDTLRLMATIVDPFVSDSAIKSPHANVRIYDDQDELLGLLKLNPTINDETIFKYDSVLLIDAYKKGTYRYEITFSDLDGLKSKTIINQFVIN
jgi:hypothetical protein